MTNHKVWREFALCQKCKSEPVKMKLTEEDWKKICKEAGTYHLPLWIVRRDYADVPIPLRIYCHLMEKES